MGANQFRAACVAGIIPHILQKLLAVENLINIAQQMIEQIELDIGQQRRSMWCCHLKRAAVQPDVTNDDFRQRFRGLLSTGARSPQNGLNAQLQFFHVEGFTQIIISAGPEPFNFVFILAFGRQEKHR
jgi:hypothetical protein